MKFTVLMLLFPLCSESCEAVKRRRGGEGRDLLQKGNCIPELFGYFVSSIGAGDTARG